MNRFFPTAKVISEARRVLADGHYGELDALMRVADLERPHESDLHDLIGEFVERADEMGLSVHGPMGFVVLVAVTYNGVSHTTPVLVDTEFCELSFTSHPDLGAGAIPPEVLVANPRLLSAVREELLGVLATWQDTGDEASDDA